MDPRTNPYAPGAGTPPPELAGRQGLIESASIALDRIDPEVEVLDVQPADRHLLLLVREAGQTSPHRT